MALQSSGLITMADIAKELGISAVGLLLTDSRLRSLAGKPSGLITFADFYGKSNIVTVVYSSNVVGGNIHTIMGSPTAAANYVFDFRGIARAGSGSFALRTGTFPAGSTLTIINNGQIRGRGGNGGSYQQSGGAVQAQAGSTGLYLDMNVTLNNYGPICGGGGGGAFGYVYHSSGSWGNSAGGGGAGQDVGSVYTSYAQGYMSLRSQAAAGGLDVGGVGGVTRHTDGHLNTGGTGGGSGAAGAAAVIASGLTYTRTLGVAGAAGAAIARNGQTISIPVGNNSNLIKGAIA